MDVQILTYTADALNVLLFTKQTRLTMDAETFDGIGSWDDVRKSEELAYMRNTIQSSWEFVDYVFAITGVTRAFTHQLVRHRVGTSFAQQTHRTVDMEGFHYLATGEDLACGRESVERDTSYPDSLDGVNPANVYDRTMRAINDGYGEMLSLGVKPQDARGVLPTNILTNIVFKANLRTLHEMALKRLCVKTQGEFQDVFRLLIERVTGLHPWTSEFLKVQCAWNGTCLFPSLPMDQCHVKPFVYNPVTARAYNGMAPIPIDKIYELHRAKRTEIQPTGKAPQ
jgi:flavin-dependent thymidylate synthase